MLDALKYLDRLVRQEANERQVGCDHPGSLKRWPAGQMPASDRDGRIQQCQLRHKAREKTVPWH